MAFTMTEAQDILKLDYLPTVREQLPTKTPWFNRITKGTEDVVGSAAVMSLRIGRNQGVGARALGGALPKAGNQRYKKLEVDTKNIYGRLEIQGKVFKAARSNKGAFINAVDAEMKGLTEGLQWDLNRELLNVPRGTLAVLAAGGPTNTLTIASSNASYNTRWLAKDMRVDIWDALGTTPKAVGRVVLSVNKSTSAFTVDGAPISVGAGDIVTREGALNNELIGLKHILTPGNTLYTIDRSLPENDFFNPIVDSNGGTNRAISETMLQKMIDEIDTESGGDPSLMLSSHGVRRAYAEILMAYKRYVEPKKLQGGWDALDFNGIPWVTDADCSRNTLYLLDEGTFKIHLMSDDIVEWGEEDGMVLRQVSGYDSYEAWMVSYLELTCDGPRKSGVVTDLTEK